MINKVILEGRLTRDPETRYSANGAAVTRFNIAVDRRYMKQGEQRQADFINIVAFRSTAEFVSKWFVKGQAIAVVGTLQSRRWEDENGKTQYGMDVVADEVHFGESKKDRDASNQAGHADNGYDTGATTAAPAKPQNFDDDFMPIDDDNLPF